MTAEYVPSYLSCLLKLFPSRFFAALSSTARVMGATIQSPVHSFMYPSATAARAALESCTPGRSTITAPVESASALVYMRTTLISGQNSCSRFDLPADVPFCWLST